MQVNAKSEKAAFTHYWANPTWTSYAKAEEGNRLNHLAGNMFHLRNVKLGDSVFVVTIRAGKLFLCARMMVEQVCSKQEAERILGYAVWDAEEHLISRDGTPMRFDRMVPEAIVRQLRFGEKPLRFESADILDRQTLRGVRKLSPESADLLNEFIEQDNNQPIRPKGR